MNTRLKKQFDVFAGLVTDTRYVTNVYQIDVSMTTSIKVDQTSHNRAYDRIVYWIDEVFYDSILIKEQSSMIDPYLKAGRNVLILPYDPVDSVVGIMLFRKLTAIVEDALSIDEVAISSSVGNQLVYYHSIDEDVDLFKSPGWWNDSRPIWINKDIATKGKIVSLNSHKEWSSIELELDQPAAGKVVPFTIKRDEDE